MKILQIALAYFAGCDTYAGTTPLSVDIIGGTIATVVGDIILYIITGVSKMLKNKGSWLR